MRTTIILNPHVKKQAQLKAVEEGKTLSQIINSMLELYVNGQFYNATLEKAQSLRESLHTGTYGFETTFDRDFIYDLPN